MKSSIRYKMIAFLTCIVGAVLFFTWILNTALAENYYVSMEKSSIIHTFEEVKECLDKEESLLVITENLEQITNRSNVKMMVATSDDFFFDQLVIFSNMKHGTKTYKQILEYLNEIRNRIIQDKNFMEKNKLHNFDQWLLGDQDNNLATLVNKGYFVTQLHDSESEQDGLYLFGFTDKNYLIAIRISIEGIRSTVHISSRFMAYMSLLAIALGSIFLSIYAYRFTEPIKEMAGVANKMAELDFSNKVNIVSKDEIGVLGNSINSLSSTLETTIGDLKQANLELLKDIEEKEEIDAMRKEFISHVSHELKTPIAIIQGYAEGLKEGIIDDPESMDYYCEVILDEAQKMNQLVRKLLTLNQIESGSTSLNISHFDLTEMIHNKIQSSQILYSDKDISVEFKEEKSVYVWADEFLIEEVFTNYFTNAMHHVKEGGIIRVWFEEKENTIRTFVSNEGKPIPDEELEKLWIKFYKVDKARTREYGGNGIGLSIVAAAMKAHNKDYGVYNTEDGVVFYFDLDT